MTPRKTFNLPRFHRTLTFFDDGTLTDNGNAYKLIGETLCTAPLLDSPARIDIEDNWGEVDFFSIDEDDKIYCAAIEAILISHR